MYEKETKVIKHIYGLSWNYEKENGIFEEKLLTEIEEIREKESGDHIALEK